MRFFLIRETIEGEEEHGRQQEDSETEAKEGDTR